MKVTSKSGLAITRRGHLIHRIRDLTATLANGRFSYDAIWICTPAYSRFDVILCGSVSGEAVICAECESVAAGPAVYRCYDAGGRLLYIGSTASKRTRLLAHERTAPWWPLVARTEAQHYPGIAEARTAEWAAIAAEKPFYNYPTYGDGRSVA